MKDMNVQKVECILRILNKKKFIPTHSVVKLKNTFKDKMEESFLKHTL